MAQAQFNYATNNGTITITGYPGHSGAVTIPAIIAGLPVTSIGDNAFYDNPVVTSVTIGNNVTHIGEYAFAGCLSLSSVWLGNSVTSIGKAAFAGCSSLTSVTIPNRVTSIGDAVFGDCYGLATVTIPNNITSIGVNAFQRCFSLTSVTIPNSVASIGLDAFSGCSSLTGVTIPDSVTYIGEGAFSACANLMAVTVGVNNPDYRSVDGILFNKNQSALLQYPAGRAGSQYTIPNGVTRIGDEAFAGCTNLISVMMLNGVTSIGAGAFYECNKLSSITIPNSVISIGNNAFFHCYVLTSYFQGNAPSFGNSVYYEDGSATIYYLPGTSGWGSFHAVPWVLPNPKILSFGPDFGVQSNRFGFLISWATNLPVVVEASTTLINPIWTPVSTNTLNNGSSYFSDLQWTNHPSRFYRLRSP